MIVRYFFILICLPLFLCTCAGNAGKGDKESKPVAKAGDEELDEEHYRSGVLSSSIVKDSAFQAKRFIDKWATESLFPTLTIIFDQQADLGLSRTKSADRVESELIAFHVRV